MASGGRRKHHKASLAGSLIIGMILLLATALVVAVAMRYKVMSKKKAALDALVARDVEMPPSNANDTFNGEK